MKMGVCERGWEGECGREGMGGRAWVGCWCHVHLLVQPATTLVAALLVPKPHPDIALIAPPRGLLCASTTGGVLIRVPGGLQWGGVHHRLVGEKKFPLKLR